MRNALYKVGLFLLSIVTGIFAVMLNSPEVVNANPEVIYLPANTNTGNIDLTIDLSKGTMDVRSLGSVGTVTTTINQQETVPGVVTILDENCYKPKVINHFKTDTVYVTEWPEFSAFRMPIPNKIPTPKRNVIQMD